MIRRIAGPGLLAFVLFVDVLFLLATLSLANATSPEAAKRALGHGVAVVTEVDSFLDENYDQVKLGAQASDEETLALEGFPLQVVFERREIVDTDRAEFRDRLIERSAALVHDEGVSAFAGGDSSAARSLSVQGLAWASFELLRPGPHNIFTILTAVFAVGGAVLYAGVALTARGWWRSGLPAASVFAASALFLLCAVATRFALRVAADGSDDYATRELLRLAQELNWAPIRDGIVLSIASGIALALSPLLLLGRRTTDRPTTTEPAYPASR